MVLAAVSNIGPKQFFDTGVNVLGAIFGPKSVPYKNIPNADEIPNGFLPVGSIIYGTYTDQYGDSTGPDGWIITDGGTQSQTQSKPNVQIQDGLYLTEGFNNNFRSYMGLRISGQSITGVRFTWMTSAQYAKIKNIILYNSPASTVPSATSISKEASTINEARTVNESSTNRSVESSIGLPEIMILGGIGLIVIMANI